MECNSYPERLDLREVYLRMCKERGVKVVISTDSHNTMHLPYIKYGVNIARRGWLEKANVINTLPVDRFLAALRPKPGSGRQEGSRKESSIVWFGVEHFPDIAYLRQRERRFTRRRQPNGGTVKMNRLFSRRCRRSGSPRRNLGRGSRFRRSLRQRRGMEQVLHRLRPRTGSRRNQRWRRSRSRRAIQNRSNFA